RPLSRSVQWSNILQKLHTFVTLASAYGIGLVVIAILAVVRRVSKNAIQLPREAKTEGRGYGITIILVLLFSWFEFESAAPTSYLIYILPVLSIAISLGSWRLLPISERNWMLLVVGVILCIVGFRDAPWPRGAGYHIASANDHAVNEALA